MKFKDIDLFKLQSFFVENSHLGKRAVKYQLIYDKLIEFSHFQKCHDYFIIRFYGDVMVINFKKVYFRNWVNAIHEHAEFMVMKKICNLHYFFVENIDYNTKLDLEYASFENIGKNENNIFIKKFNNEHQIFFYHCETDDWANFILEEYIKKNVNYREVNYV